MQSLTPFSCVGVNIRESCWLEGKLYFTRRAIGEWLEAKKPQTYIDNIIERNPYISDPRWSVTLNLRATDGKKYLTELYDPISLQLIIMESKLPKALEYKIAVATLVWAYATNNIGFLQIDLLLQKIGRPEYKPYMETVYKVKKVLGVKKVLSVKKKQNRP